MVRTHGLEPNPFNGPRLRFFHLGIYKHCIGPANFMLCRADEGVQIRFFDFKTQVYRQLISPRFFPNGRRTVQMLTIDRVLSKFNGILAAMPSD